VVIKLHPESDYGGGLLLRLMKLFTVATVPLGAVLLSSCASQTVETVPVSDVLTALKLQIASIRPEVEVPAGASACFSSGHSIRVVATPIKAVAEFKTVVTAAETGTGSANIPAGPSGVIVSPSLGASYSNIATTDITMNLGIQHVPPTASDLRAEIASLQKYIASGKSMIADLKENDPTQGNKAIQETQTSIHTAQATLTQDEINLADIENRRGPTPLNGPSPFGARPPKPLPAPATGRIVQNLSISEAVNKAIVGILQTSHERPCFLPQELDVKVNFEVVKNVNGGVSIAFLVAKIGATASKTDDATQSVTITFDLSQGTS
jgi:hypothetical protein